MPARRRWKYKALIDTLKDDELYSPASLAALGLEMEPFCSLPPEEKKRAHFRIRKALGPLPEFYDFPRDGDAILRRPGRPIAAGWYGWRWKEAAREVPKPEKRKKTKNPD